MDNVKEWTSLSMTELLTIDSDCRKDWKRISAELSLVSPDDPVGQGTELNILRQTTALEVGAVFPAAWFAEISC